jgi:serine/threonine-protein kinase
LGNLALGEKRYEEAEAAYGRMEEIYRRTRGEGHYLVATALSNRATVRLERGEYARAEAMYRDVVARYEKALPAGHVNTAVARIRLGRSLLRQRRFGEAVAESQAGYQMLRGAAHASVSWLQGARQDLAAAYAALGEGERAAQYRREWEEGNR